MTTFHYTMPKGFLSTKGGLNNKITLVKDIYKLFLFSEFTVHISNTVKDFDWIMISGNEQRIKAIMNVAFCPLPPEVGVRVSVC